MTYMKNTTVHKLKKQKHPVYYKDKNDARTKVVILRGTLMKLYNYNNFWQILVYVILL